MTHYDYDIAIIGGGLAGTSLAILCARSGWSVALIEKETYPRHKVCGEYISMESYDFLQDLGLPLEEMNLPHINTFRLTSWQNIAGQCKLTKGGIGISRYVLDKSLADLAVKEGATLLTGEKVTHIGCDELAYQVTMQSKKMMKVRLVVGAYGRHSGLQPSNSSPVNNFIGVKYHVTQGPDDDTIEIHHFKDGYCGISKIEKEKYCMCYLVRADAFKLFKGNISDFETATLAANPYLKPYLDAKRLTPPITTSGLVFRANTDVKLPYPITGDAAGFIPPVTGNGMSLAFRSAKHVYQLIDEHLSKGRKEIILRHNKKYISRYLSHRIHKGIFLQDILLTKNERLSRILLKTATRMPVGLKMLSSQAVGSDI